MQFNFITSIMLCLFNLSTPRSNPTNYLYRLLPSLLVADVVSLSSTRSFCTVHIITDTISFGTQYNPEMNSHPFLNDDFPYDFGAPVKPEPDPFIGPVGNGGGLPEEVFDTDEKPLPSPPSPPFCMPDWKPGPLLNALAPFIVPFAPPNGGGLPPKVLDFGNGIPGVSPGPPPSPPPCMLPKPVDPFIGPVGNGGELVVPEEAFDTDDKPPPPFWPNGILVEERPGPPPPSPPPCMLPNPLDPFAPNFDADGIVLPPPPFWPNGIPVGDPDFTT
jgi:hypothetical protein